MWARTTTGVKGKVALVPPKREKLLRSPKMGKIPSKKVKVQVRVCQSNHPVPAEGLVAEDTASGKLE